MMVGLGEGARFLAGVEWSGLELRIGDQYLTIRDAVCDFRRHVVGPSPRLLRYHFVSPWLPLSQENYQRYRSLSAMERIAERDRLAVAGILIGLRGFGVDFPGRLYAAFEQQRPNHAVIRESSCGLPRPVVRQRRCAGWIRDWACREPRLRLVVPGCLRIFWSRCQ